MPSVQSKNNLLAGMLVIFALIAVVIITAQLGGVTERFGKQRYVVEFPLELGVPGLSKGSLVLVGGKPVGVVTDVRFHFDQGASGRVIGHLVDILIDNDIELYALPENAQPNEPTGSDGPDESERLFSDRPVIVRGKPLLGTKSELNFVTVAPMTLSGDPVPDAQRLEPGSIIMASKPESLLQSLGVDLAALGLDTESLNAALGDIARVAASIKEQYEGEIRPAISSITSEEEGIPHIVSLVTDEAEGLPAMRARINERLDQFRDILDGFQESVSPTFEKWPAVFDNYAETGENFRLGSENFVDASESFNRIITKVEQDYLLVVDDILGQGRETLTTAQTTVDEVLASVRQADPKLQDTLANLRLSSDQLRDTLIEVRRSPWRLLYRPSDQESEYELLYDAARLYASSVTKLRTAVVSLESIDRSGRDDEASAEASRRLVEQLNSAFEDYQRAEAVFLERLINEAPTPEQ